MGCDVNSPQCPTRPPGDGQEVLAARGLGRSFGSGPARVDAVSSVDLSLHEGECLGLVGESGSGKTTLARMLASLIRPSRGEVLIGGEPVEVMRRREGRRVHRHVQMVFQNPPAAFSPRMTMGVFLEQGLRHLCRVSAARARGSVGAMLEQVGLDEGFADRLPGELSGGELQRVVIARALSVSPDVLVLDEPTGALDVATQRQILDLLRRLRASSGMAQLLIGHDIGVVQHLADRIAVMHRGRIVEVLAADRFERDAQHRHSRDLIAAQMTLRRRG
ncbi:MAG: dipeptide/oligopeptide/nickel ABC transporter ATP-binding protein [Aeromicrobium sp.]|uniref:ABC transporter ATP-binding protein n=1 Tax=Aeromicrobium sp. TaxID=1871063 RepID=UPI0039E370BD